MIIPDVNILLYAYNRDAPDHGAAREWWEDLMQSGGPIGLAWVVILGFLRVSTHPRIWPNPMSPAEAARHIRSWLGQPNVQIITPGERHADVLLALL